MSVLSGVGIGLLCMVLFAAVGAYLITAGILPREQEGLLVGVSTFVAALIGAICTVRGCDGKRGVAAILFAVGLAISLLLFGLAIFGDRISGVWVTMLLILGTSITTALFRPRNQKKFRPAKLRI